ncbi:hypothetical protein [Streptomyces sp. NPDC086010]|uniref:hypothetical protein n=1 Tax=Streptomyces sp. NPDC086010 TaxID=3365745 RepID=UPI0037D0E21D
MAVDLSFFRSESSQRLRAEGKTEGKADAVVQVLEQRGIAGSGEVGARIRGCTDITTLDRYLVLALSASSAAELFEQG